MVELHTDLKIAEHDIISFTPEEAKKIASRLLKSKDCFQKIFVWRDPIESTLTLRSLSKRGMEISQEFYKQFEVVGKRIFNDLTQEYPGKNPMKIPIEATIGCIKDIEDFSFCPEIIVLKDLVISPFCRCPDKI